MELPQIKIAGVPLRHHGHVCVYDSDRFTGRVLIDVLRTHPLAIVAGVVHENPFYVPPDELLQELRSRSG